MLGCEPNQNSFIIKTQISNPRHEIFRQFLPKIIKRILIKFDIIDHIAQVCIHDSNDLFDIMPTLASVLNFEFYLLIVAFADLL